MIPFLLIHDLTATQRAKFERLSGEANSAVTNTKKLFEGALTEMFDNKMVDAMMEAKRHTDDKSGELDRIVSLLFPF